MGECGSSPILLEETFKVSCVDHEGKMLKKVSRIECVSYINEVHISLDIHSEIYPMETGQYHSFILASSLALNRAKINGSFNIHENNSQTLLEKCTYGMYGKIFKHTFDKGLLIVHISFGGLIMTIRAQPTDLAALKPDSNVYLLLNRL